MRPQHWHSVLFVPGDRPDRMKKAVGCGAHAVVLDLEDAVSPDAKDEARAVTVERLRAGLPGSVMVRVNSTESGLLERDIDALRPVLSRVDAVLLPKAQGSGDVLSLERLLEHEAGLAGPTMIPIVETPNGVFEARSTASASSRVSTLLFGLADLSAELGVEPTADGHELAQARAHVVLATAAAGLQAPLDGPYLVLGDFEGLAVATRVARDLGFGGKVVIHPEQISVVRDGFGVRTADIAWAEQVVAAAAAATEMGSGVSRLDDGTFVDEPILRRAKTILDQLPDEPDEPPPDQAVRSTQGVPS